MKCKAFFCCSGVPRKSQFELKHGVTAPQAIPRRSKDALIQCESIFEGSSMGISTDSKPHFLKRGNNFTLSFVNGEAKRKVLIPKRIISRSGQDSFHNLRFIRGPNQALIQSKVREAQSL